ncbi:hypothetical protein MACH09_13770 [Vibrio sp. MACH09]|uniref:hypothetical protein n=1 Tax=Vibrio sp. MACH09 TaxID=3025122 RepID=UPI00279288DB|nr:hypothetical protein [Vibrio sp. MACH09]GLO60869.1 hypothetical protein MACH09_13770 [Vibrio sp. MACH09]
MQIEIYMPCEPQSVCDVINITFVLIAVIAALLFIRVLIHEYKNIQGVKKTKRPSKSSKRKQAKKK